MPLLHLGDRHTPLLDVRVWLRCSPRSPLPVPMCSPIFVCWPWTRVYRQRNLDNTWIELEERNRGSWRGLLKSSVLAPGTPNYEQRQPPLPLHFFRRISNEPSSGQQALPHPPLHLLPPPIQGLCEYPSYQLPYARYAGLSC